MSRRSVSTLIAAAVRWPPTIAITGLLAAGWMLPERYGLLPNWVKVPLWVLAAAFFGVSLWGHFSPTARSVERVATVGMLSVITAVMLVAVLQLTRRMFTSGSNLEGTRLLSTGVSLWVSNLLCFALWYWFLDRGSPDGRGAGAAHGHDFMFARPSPDVSPEPWTPGFVDYVFVAFNTSVAFSPTDTTPISTRAKVLMMVQASVSLVTLALVVARAVNLVD
jgi:hypothetical protein